MNEDGTTTAANAGTMTTAADLFATELASIASDRLRNCVTECLDAYLPALIETPSSRGHHPPDERGRFGVVLHLKRVAWFCKCIELELQLPREDLDALYAAALVHDLAKIKVYRTVDGTTVGDDSAMRIHPQISIEMVRPFLTPLEPALRNRILTLIGSHMGHWYDHCPQPATELERLFGMADFVVSRTDCLVEVDLPMHVRYARGPTDVAEEPND